MWGSWSQSEDLYVAKESSDLPEEPGVFALDGVGLVVVGDKQVGHREQGGVPGFHAGDGEVGEEENVQRKARYEISSRQ